MFENATDYLVDYASSSKCDEWISKVIRVYLQGQVEEYGESLIQELLGKVAADVNEIQVSNGNESINTIKLLHLNHISGVNALADNQTIKFNQEVNVIYGLNGTGKSSYFKILNEIIGGGNETPIIGDIYKDEPSPIDVKLKFTADGVPGELSWNGSSRGCANLKSIRVFDSTYTRDLLKKRNSDELVVKPYGLHLFADIIDLIDSMVEQANSTLEVDLINVPTIDTTKVIDSSKNILDKESFEPDGIVEIEKLFQPIDNLEQQIENLTKEIAEIQKGNPSDKINIEKNKKKVAEDIVALITKLVKEQSVYELTLNSYIEKYAQAKKESEDYKTKLEILKTLPGTNSEYWKQFISAGALFAKENELTECPYCHQPYSDYAKSIVDAYTLFLENQAENELSETEIAINKYRDKISIWNTDIFVDENVWNSNFISLLQELKNRLIESKKTLIESIDSKKKASISKDNCDDLLKTITIFAADCEKKITDYSLELDGQSRIQTEKEGQLTILISSASLLNQKETIKEVIATKNNIALQRKRINEISTLKAKISTLSKKAHNELLTEQLQDLFSDILQSLNVKNIEIELKGKNNNGVQQTELLIKSHKDVTAILSEGEQKATALALFLAELRMSQNASTIIFDDPVNSLDHRMMAAFAEQLLQLNNQVIVFTHNKMFLNCFETTDMGHVCKGYNSACCKNKGKHIYVYETESEGKSRKGVIVEKNIENVDYYLTKIEDLLKKTPFTQKDEACTKLRRSVETAIDEVVFNKQVPTQFSNKNSRINWNELKNLYPDGELIEQLKKIHSRASGGELHNGSEREENPVDKEEIETMCAKMREITRK